MLVAYYVSRAFVGDTRIKICFGCRLLQWHGLEKAAVLLLSLHPLSSNEFSTLEVLPGIGEGVGLIAIFGLLLKTLA